MPEDAAALRGAIDQKEDNEVENELSADDLERLDAVLGGKGLKGEVDGETKNLVLNELEEDQIEEFFQGLAELGKDGRRSIAAEAKGETITGEGQSLGQDLTKIADLHTKEDEDQPKITTEDLNALQVPNEEKNQYTSVMTQLAEMKDKFVNDVETTVADGLENLRQEIMGVENGGGEVEDTETTEDPKTTIESLNLTGKDFTDFDLALASMDNSTGLGYEDVVETLPSKDDFLSESGISDKVIGFFEEKFGEQYPSIFSGKNDNIRGVVNHGGVMVFVNSDGEPYGTDTDGSPDFTKTVARETANKYGWTEEYEPTCPPGFKFVEKGEIQHAEGGPIITNMNVEKDEDGNITKITGKTKENEIPIEFDAETGKMKPHTISKDIDNDGKDDKITINTDGTMTIDYGDDKKETTTVNRSEAKNLSSGLDALASMVDKFLPYLTQLGLLRDKVTNPDDFDDSKQTKYNIARLEGKKLNGGWENKEVSEFYLSNVTTMSNAIKLQFLQYENEQELVDLANEYPNGIDADQLCEELGINQYGPVQYENVPKTLQDKIERDKDNIIIDGKSYSISAFDGNTIQYPDENNPTHTISLNVDADGNPVISAEEFSEEKEDTDDPENEEETPETTPESAEAEDIPSDLNFGFGAVSKVAYETTTKTDEKGNETHTTTITIGEKENPRTISFDKKIPDAGMNILTVDDGKMKQITIKTGEEEGESTLKVESASGVEERKTYENYLTGDYQFMGETLFKEVDGENVLTQMVGAIPEDNKDAEQKICNSLEEYFKNGEGMDKKVLPAKAEDGTDFSLEGFDKEIDAIKKDEDEILLTINGKQYVLPLDGPKEKEEE